MIWKEIWEKEEERTEDSVNTWNIGASESLFTATMTLESLMPAIC